MDKYTISLLAVNRVTGVVKVHSDSGDRLSMIGAQVRDSSHSLFFVLFFSSPFSKYEYQFEYKSSRQGQLEVWKLEITRLLNAAQLQQNMHRRL